MFDLLGNKIEELSSCCSVQPPQGRLLGIAKAYDQSSAWEGVCICLAFSPLESDRGANYHPNFTVLKKRTKSASQLENKVCGPSPRQSSSLEPDKETYATNYTTILLVEQSPVVSPLVPSSVINQLLELTSTFFFLTFPILSPSFHPSLYCSVHVHSHCPRI